jgi:hypothetical protein
MAAWLRVVVVGSCATACTYSAPAAPDANEPDLPTVGFAAGSSTADERSGTIQIAVALSELAPGPVSVRYAVIGGTAQANSDFTLGGNGTLQFATGEASQTFDITIVADADEAELAETIVLGLTSPAGARLGLAEHTVTIADRPLPRVSFARAETTSSEASPSMIEIVLDAPSQGASTVELALSGTATEGEDYTLANNTVVSFGDGATSAMVAIGEIDDALDEDDLETLVLALQNPSSNLILGAQATAVHRIADNDASPGVGFQAATTSRNENAGTVNVIVALTAVSGRDVSVDYAVAAGSTAVVPADATLSPAPGTLVIAKGQTQVTIAVTIVDDVLDEPDERLDLVLQNAVNATLGTATHQLTIVDNDAPPTISFEVSGVTRGEGTATVNALVVLSGPSGRTINAPFSIGNTTTATTPADFTVSTPSPLVFTPGTTMLPITITIVQDDLDEPDELVALVLGNASNATEVAPTTFTLTITDDDDPSVVQFDPLQADGSAPEGNPPPGTRNFTYDLVLDRPSGFTITVPIDFSGDADEGDFTASGVPVVFAPGETRRTITLSIIADLLPEPGPSDTIIMSIGTPTNATVGANDERRHDILDDDDL